MPRKMTFAGELAAVRRALRGLPGVSERGHYGGPGFFVNGRMFALFWMKEGRWIFKLPHDRLTILFEVRPETFAPMRSGRMIWSYVKIANLDAGELKGLLAQAWREAAPKTLVKSILPGAPSSASGETASE